MAKADAGRPPDEFDGPWKTVLQNYLPDFLEFFFPVAWQAIAWQHGFESLDQELRQLLPDAANAGQRTDALFKVRRHDGRDSWVIIHIEVQTTAETDFARRMFRYFYRIYDVHDLAVASFAVLGDDQPRWLPGGFAAETWGTEVSFKFPVAKLLDWEGRWAELEASPNPFAAVVMAHLKTRATRGRPEERRRWKLRIARELYRRGMQSQRVHDLFNVIDWMMKLERDQAIIFKTELTELEAALSKPYLNSIEQLILEEALAEGLAKGRAEAQLAFDQGIIVGRLSQRFGPLPPELKARIAESSREELARWQARIEDARCLGDVLD